MDHLQIMYPFQNCGFIFQKQFFCSFKSFYFRVCLKNEPDLAVKNESCPGWYSSYDDSSILMRKQCVLLIGDPPLTYCKKRYTVVYFSHDRQYYVFLKRYQSRQQLLTKIGNSGINWHVNIHAIVFISFQCCIVHCAKVRPKSAFFVPFVIYATSGLQQCVSRGYTLSS